LTFGPPINGNKNGDPQRLKRPFKKFWARKLVRNPQLKRGKKGKNTSTIEERNRKRISELLERWF